MENQGIQWDDPLEFSKVESLAWDSFRTNYPDDFVDMIKCIN